MHVNPRDKPLVWLHGQVKTPPLGALARLEAGFLPRRLQRGDLLTMPNARPMPQIGARVHELRITDAAATWRVIYRIDPDAIVIVDVFGKKTARTPPEVLDRCRERLRGYDDA